MVNNEIKEKLVLQAQKGDKVAYARLIRHQYKRVYLLCYSIVGDEHHAEDISQEVFLKAFMKLKSLRNPIQFEQWLGKIAKNLSLNFIKRKNNQLRINENITAKSQRTNPSSESLLALKHAISNLPVELRTPLVMYYFDGRKVTAVADMLGISSSNVYSRLRSALRQLKIHLQQEI